MSTNNNNNLFSVHKKEKKVYFLSATSPNALLYDTDNDNDI